MFDTLSLSLSLSVSVSTDVDLINFIKQNLHKSIYMWGGQILRKGPELSPVPNNCRCPK